MFNSPYAGIICIDSWQAGSQEEKEEETEADFFACKKCVSLHFAMYVFFVP